MADQARAAYRALNGTLALSSLPAAVHSVNEADGSLSLANLVAERDGKSVHWQMTSLSAARHEPTAYVTEYFLGDGITTQFNLSDDVFTPPSAESTLIRELFNEGQIDLRLWGNPGAHGYFSLGAGGLVMQGGTGEDGETQLAWRDPS